MNERYRTNCFLNNINEERSTENTLFIQNIDSQPSPASEVHSHCFPVPRSPRPNQIVQPKSMMLPPCSGLTFVFETNFRLQDSCNLLCFIYLSCCHFRRLNLPAALWGARTMADYCTCSVRCWYRERERWVRTLTLLSAYSAVYMEKMKQTLIALSIFIFKILQLTYWKLSIRG